MMTNPGKQLTDQRWLDFWTWFKGEQQQIKGVLALGRAIRNADPGLLVEGAPWAQQFSEKPQAATTAPAQPTTFELDPRTPAEDGLAGPGKKAPMKPGDTYLLVNDRTQQMRAYSHTGALLWTLPCIARGQGRDTDWSHTNTDTPPGLYKLGKLYADYEQNPNPPCSDTAMAYGWYSFDMEELEGQEVAVGRAGIMLHGGGTACGWPGAWAPKQSLHPTLGCLRMQNIDLRDQVLPLIAKGIVYIGVFQER